MLAHTNNSTDTIDMYAVRYLACLQNLVNFHYKILKTINIVCNLFGGICIGRVVSSSNLFFSPL